ncbi:CCA1, partial [Symbiodinium sp. CCMP2592]
MAAFAKARTSILLLLFGCAFCFCAWHPVRSRSSRPVARRSSDKQEIVYNYFAQDYALVTRKEETFDVGQWLSELLPWSDGELRARDVLSEILPKWRSIDVGPQTDIALRRRFRALTAATGGEEPALAAMRRNIAILYFGEGQIQRAGEVLQRLLGKERAAQVIQKNPGVLTIDPRNLENNISAVCVAADVIDVLVQNGQVARLTAGAVGIFFALGIAKALGDVIYLRTLPREDEKKLTFHMAKSLGIHDLPPDEAVQVLWWSKVLIDDPLRICRALRFAAKFKFKLHPAFWKAAPFALEPLRTKVAGSRKFTEYQKIGGYGFKACFEFFELAFSYTFGPGEGCSRLASALLGGQDDKAKPRMLSQVHAFDRDCFRTLADAVQPCEGQKHDGVELLGELMVAAIAAAQFEADGDPVAEFTTACDGMCVSNAMREAGLSPLNASIAMAAEAPSLNALDIHVADACGISLDSLGRHVQVWEAMQICNSRTGPEYATPYRRQLALAFVRLRAPDMAAEVQACFEALSFSRPPVRGTVLNAKGVLEVPPPLRRQVMLLFEVSTRVLKYAAPVEAGESLQQLFDAHPKLRQAFSSSVWM